MALQTLFDSISAEIDAGRIGRPVSVRGFYEISSDHGHLLHILAREIHRACHGWLGDLPARVLASGTVESGHVNALVEGAAGTTCVISSSVQRRGHPFLDIIVLGDRGTVRHEGDASGPDVDTQPGEGLTPSAAEAALHGALERSLASRSPVEMPGAPPGKGGKGQ